MSIAAETVGPGYVCLYYPLRFSAHQEKAHEVQFNKIIKAGIIVSVRIRWD